MPSGGHNRRPNEAHRKLGTLRPDRHSSSLGNVPDRLVDPIAHDAEPPRPLGHVGRTVWDWAITTLPWLGESDAEMVCLLAEVSDEMTALRRVMLEGSGDWRDGVSLDKLRTQYRAMLSELGASPSARSRGTLGEVSEVLSRRASLTLLRETDAPTTKDIFVVSAVEVEGGA